LRRSVTKADFTKVFGTAFLRAFTKDSILAAFKATGIHPFNPDIIKPAQMKPSEATSVKGGFPLQHASPVMAVMAAFNTEIDPACFMPSKRIRLMKSALEKTSGSFLVSGSRLLSKDMIGPPVLEGPPALPAPDWTHKPSPSQTATSRARDDN